MPPIANPLLPRPGIRYQYTLDELQEYAKCAQDPVYFVKHYVKIMSLDKGLVPFELYDFQENMIRSYHENRFSITLCSRQVGKSTTVIAYMLWCVLFNTNYSACISANKQRVAGELLGRLKLAFENLPRFLQQGVLAWNKLEIELENGSRCFAAATSSSAVRGGSYNLLLLDEYAFVPPNIADEFYASTYPTISSGGTTKLIMVSTPNGINHFHKFWVDAKGGVNDFVPIFVHWSEVPGRDEKWKQTTIRNIGGEEKFRQEYDCDFLTTSYTLIKAQFLNTMSYAKPIAQDDAGEYLEFVAPDPTRTYLLCADTGSGQDKDDSAFLIFDITTLPYTVVASFKCGSLSSMEYPNVIHKYAMRYNTAWVMVEAMDVGRDVGLLMFREFDYPHMLTTMVNGKWGQKLTFGMRENRSPGLRVSYGAKKAASTVIKALIERQLIQINDHRVVQQLSTFVRKGATFQAEYGHKDDMVTPLIILGWLSLQPNFAEITQSRSLSEFIDRAENEEDGTRVYFTDDNPMPAGVSGRGGYEAEDDPNWLLR